VFRASFFFSVARWAERTKEPEKEEDERSSVFERKRKQKCVITVVFMLMVLSTRTLTVHIILRKHKNVESRESGRGYCRDCSENDWVLCVEEHTLSTTLWSCAKKSFLLAFAWILAVV
jgi:hypothetical protein